MTKWRKRLLVLGIVVAALLVLALAALYHGLISRTYTVRSDKLTNEAPIRLVLLTDLHNHIYDEDQQPLIDRVRRMEPDLICLFGDIADDILPHTGTELLLQGLVEIAPTYYATGNHEHWSNMQGIRAVFDRWNVPMLENEGVLLTIKGQPIYLYGLDDPDYTRAHDYGRFFEGMDPLPEDVFSILLSHRPDPMDTYVAQGFDLVLSGHAHGGQVRIPLLVNGLYAPDQGWFPQYAGGVYTVGGTTMVVSRGLSYYENLPRVFNPPEVVCILLKSK